MIMMILMMMMMMMMIIMMMMIKLKNGVKNQRLDKSGWVVGENVKH